MSEHSQRPVAVIACGVIGRSWIRVFTRAGYDVRVWDRSPDAVRAALVWHEMEAARAPHGGGSAHGCATLAEALAGAAWVQESGPENLDAKRALYAELEALAEPDAILASSTSTLDMTEIARGVAGGHRCIVAHPVNPPHVIPAVEVLGGEATSSDVVDRSVEFLRTIGQVPVRMHRYVPGFLLNRMQAALVREAIALVQGGVADVEAVDTVIREGLGLRWALMGPFGVANTNADGGVREYFGRYGSSFTTLMNDLAPTPAFDAALVDALGEGTDAMYGDVSRERLRAWRDQMVERITALKLTQGGP